ncbi:helix-turn-helix transcriptional regulator [Rhodovulum sp. YNF3179]|uniref:AraC family transcriptional regulator n=1 Tax=Rhodovulum sp. YNF3179 TaxID=3425127 RepID=UPI003D345ABC
MIATRQWSFESVPDVNQSEPALISTMDLGNEASFDFWREATRGTYRLGVPPKPARKFRMISRMWAGDGCILSDFKCTDNVKFREPAHVANDKQAYLKLRYYFSGGSRVIAGNETYTLLPGSVYLIDQSRPIAEISKANHQINLFVSHAEIGFDPERCGPCLDFSGDSLEGRILSTALIRSVAVGTDNGAPQGPAGLDDLIHRLRIILEGSVRCSTDRSMQEARRQAIGEWVENAMADPELDVARIVAKSGCSRATLYRDFEDYGGLARFIYQRRLNAAFRLLISEKPGWGRVGAVAEATGFSSIHTFSKMFRREFGYNPSDVLGMGAPADPNAEQVSAVEQADHCDLQKARKFFEVLR